MVSKTIVRYFLTLSLFKVDLVWYVGFFRKKLTFFWSMSNISMWIYGKCGEITYTSNMYKIDSLIITIKLFVQNIFGYFWNLYNMVTITILRYFLTLSLFNVDLVWYVGFFRKKLTFFNLCQIYQCEFTVNVGRSHRHQICIK